jgi:hypothetical protein
MDDLLGIPREEAEGRVIIGALVDALFALRDLVEASESIAMYPEGSVGLENLAEEEAKARKILDRFDFTSPDESSGAVFLRHQ